MEHFLHKSYNFFLKGFKSALFVVVFCLMGVMGKGQVTGDFQTKNATGNWSDFNAWNLYNGSAWIAATSGQIPISTSNVYVQNGHTITIDNNTAECNHLNVNGGTTSRVAFAVNAILNVYGDLNISSSSIPFVSSWGSGSKLVFTGSANQTVTNQAAATIYENLEINKVGGVFNFPVTNLKFNKITLTAGVVNVGSGSDFTGSGTSPSININGGTWIQIGGATRILSSIILNINNGGNITLATTSNATGFNFSSISITGGGILNLNAFTGIMTISNSLSIDATSTLNTALTTTPAAPTMTLNGTVNYNRSGNQNILNNTHVNLKTNVSGTKSLTGATTITNNLDLNSSTLDIAGYTLTLDAASLTSSSGYLTGTNTSDLIVTGTTGGNITIPQNGNISLRNFIISGTRTVAMNGINNLNLSGALTIGSTAIFDNGGESQIFLYSGSSVTIDGRFITRDAAGFTNSGGTIPSTDISPTLNAGCIIEYGSLLPQVVNARPDYKNITISGSGIKSLSGPCFPVGTVYITDNAVFETGNHAFGDVNTNLKMDGGKFRMAGTGTKPNIDGIFTLTDGVIEFYNMLGTAQTIKGLNSVSTPIAYKAIEITGNNVANSNSNITLADGGTFTIKNGGIFTINDEAIIGPSGTQTVIIENGGRFVCGDVHGFTGGNGADATSIRSDIETVNLISGSSVEYSRSTAQVFSSRNDYQNIIISGGGEKTLNGPVTMSGILTLTNGLVNTTNTNLLTMDPNATCPAGGNSASFINGPLHKIGSSDFIFPVGKKVGSEYHYRTIGISALSKNLNFTAEFKRENATLLGSVTALGPPPLVRVSACEYWTLDRKGSSDGNANVTLSWTNQSPCNTANYVSELATLVVAHFNGTSWDNYGGQGNVSSGSTTTAGSITWVGVTTFSPFSLGSVSVKENILPFTLSSFTARARKSDIQIDWNVTNNIDQDEYILEHSKDGIQFTTLRVVKSKVILNQAAYTELDQNPYNGWNYYRLKAKDNLDREKVSQIIKVWFGFADVIRICPNPASEKININLAEPSSINHIQLVNSAGQILKQVNNIQFSNEINISELAAGLYYLRLTGKNGLAIKSFVKR